MVSTLFWLLVVMWLARWVTSGWRPARPALEPTYQAEVARLRDEVDQLSTQVARLTDEQQFLMRLLSDGQAPKTALPPQPPQPENP